MEQQKSREGIPYPEVIKYQNMDAVRELNLANFGTGMGYYDFCFEGLPVRAFNFSLPQQSLEFDYKLMRHYQEKLLSGCRVCLVLPYCIFLANHIPEVDEINERYYFILPREEVESRCNTAFEAYAAKQEYWEKCRKKISENLVPALEEIHEKRIQENQVEELLNIWKRQLGILSFESGLQRTEWHRKIAASKGWLTKILLLCKEKSWKPVVIVPPMSRILLDKIGPAFRKANFYDILQEIVGEEVPVLDYSGNSDFCNPDLYGAPCFLAKKGAKRFTKDVLRRIGML